jgi:hypothetical protein
VSDLATTNLSSLSPLLQSIFDSIVQLRQVIEEFSPANANRRSGEKGDYRRKGERETLRLCLKLATTNLSSLSPLLLSIFVRPSYPSSVIS